MRENLTLSAAILAALVPLATTGVLGLAAVVAAHEIAELVVIANGVRAGRRTRPSGGHSLCPREPRPISPPQQQTYARHGMPPDSV